MNWDAVTKLARECHTKQAWSSLSKQYGEALATTNSSKPIQDLFKLLHADPQCLQYEPKLWGQLLQGCLSSWNLELGREIAECAKKIPSPLITIPAAQVYLDSGFPSVTREIASRSLRLTGLSPMEKLQFEMLVCVSYAEEGKREKAIRILSKIASSLRSNELEPKDRANFLYSMGRMQFLLGRYLQASDAFYDASKLYRQVSDWESAAKSIFNTATCQLNSGTKKRDEAFAMIEECRRLAEAEDLPGLLSHCVAVYGVDAYDHGDFAAAREHLRKALEYLPASDKGHRRLHIVSMLTLTYLAMGRYHLAHRFGKLTLELDALGESERYNTRYTTLQARLLWEEGKIEESQKLLENATKSLESDGVHTLEELTALSQYNLHSAWLNQRNISSKFNIDDSLKKNYHSWIDRKYSLGQLMLNQDNFKEAEHWFNECLTKARQAGHRLQEANGTLGLVQSLLQQRRPDEAETLIRDLEVMVARLGETPLRTQMQFIHAARSYQQGAFTECERILKQAMKSNRLSFVDRFLLSSCIATIEGRSPRLTAEWQIQLMARFTRTLFAPTLEAVDEKHFRVSGHYIVSLERHPSLAELLHFLFLKSNFSADASEVQTQVWKQSLQSQGWQQKIRNTIMRLRDFFPYTIAPIIVHGESIALFKEAITIQPSRQEGLKTEDEVLRLLKDSPMSSTQLSRRLDISTATAKRILKRLNEESEVVAVKQGRNIFYKVESESTR